MRFLQMSAANYAGCMIADRSGRPVLDGADDRGENGTGDTAAGDLADDAADIRRRSRIRQQRDQHAEDLSTGAAADGARERVAERAEIDVLGRPRGDIAADGAADDLNEQVDEQSRHDAILPDPESVLACAVPDDRRRVELRRSNAKGHAARAKD